MKSTRFDYRRQHSLPGLAEDLATFGTDAAILAGGQSLMPLMNLRLARPVAVLDINPIQELAGISVADDRLHIGAATRHRLIERSALVSRHAPLIAAAIPLIASPTIRNRATIGGNIALSSPISELSACCLSLEARIHLYSKYGRRSVAAADFFVGPLRTAANPEEVIVDVEIPTAKSDERFAIREISSRHGGHALAGVAVRARRRGQRLQDLRIAFFGIAGQVALSPSVAAVVERSDKPIAGADLRAAIAQDFDVIGDRDDPPAVRLHLASVVAARALNEAWHDHA